MGTSSKYFGRWQMWAQVACLALIGAAQGCDSAEPRPVRAASTKRPTATTAKARQVASRTDHKVVKDDEVIDPVESDENEQQIDEEGVAENPFAGDEPGLSEAARAVNTIASEIHASLALKSVHMIWLFDATTSAQNVLQEVVRRLERDGRVLDARRKAVEHELLWSAVAFGEKLKLLGAEPTHDVATFLAGVAELPEDSSGIENTFAAIDRVVDLYAAEAGARDRYVFLVVVTDEVGDDAARVDAVAERLKRLAIQTYVIGPAAPFGYEGSLTAVAEVENWRPLRQGPESRELELVDVTASGRSQAAALMDSGCGPFALTYLTLQTDGQLFVVHRQAEAGPAGVNFSPATDVIRFDPHVIARYLPDYVSAAEYQRLQNGNGARCALNATAKLPPIALATDLKREFVPKDPAALKRQLDEAQRVVARLEPRLKQFYETLSAGESDRDRLTPRWRANYDLAMGRVLSARARLEGYNSMLARLKTQSTLHRPESTRWVLTEAETFAGDSVLNKLARRARDYLEGVVSTHSGTPWAWLAKHELQVPMAWNWVEQ